VLERRYLTRVRARPRITISGYSYEDRFPDTRGA
jgi:hypothetical protein